MKKTYAVILAAGSGERIHSAIPKQFLKVRGRTLVEYAVEAFERNKNIDEIIIVIHPRFRSVMEKVVLKNKYKKVSKILNGGKTRRESSSIGVNAIENESSFVLIHDAVRPFVSDRIINQCMKALEKYDAVNVAIPATDTIIKVDDSMLIEDVPDRRYMMRNQTPQAFKAGIIKKAHKMASKDKTVIATDDCSIIFKYKLGNIYTIKGEERNIKVTYAGDLCLGDKFFRLSNINSNKRNI